MPWAATQMRWQRTLWPGLRPCPSQVRLPALAPPPSGRNMRAVRSHRPVRCTPSSCHRTLRAPAPAPCRHRPQRSRAASSDRRTLPAGKERFGEMRTWCNTGRNARRLEISRKGGWTANYPVSRRAHPAVPVTPCSKEPQAARPGPESVSCPAAWPAAGNTAPASAAAMPAGWRRHQRFVFPAFFSAMPANGPIRSRWLSTMRRSNSIWW